jgi:hypothetical protein
MKHYLAFIFCCSAAQVSGQQFIERGYLKDSVTFYEGYIIEQAPAKYVSIAHFKQKNTAKLGQTDTWKLNKAYPEQKKTAPLEQPNKRYYKSVSLELGGKALTYSVNFDMRTERGRRNGWGVTAGLSVLGSNTPGQGIVFFVPFGGNYLFGKKKDFFELGAGATYLFLIGGIRLDSNWLDNRWGASNDDTRIFGTFTFGYRHIPLANGITWRLAFNPIFIGSKLRPWFGLGVGYQFW